ncbi:hypothetical protein ACIQVT_13115 [Streptomyces sp. NPDC100445]|uniref:hypothetical protein n=1 Tax=Streptomyces sp. NPDC100445 TaxID=3366102 RepID=UPI00382917C3
MNKPYSTHLAVWGDTVVLTLCRVRRVFGPDHSELALRYVLSSLPDRAEVIVIDLDHGPRRPQDRARVLEIVHRYAVEKALHLVSIGAPRRAAPSAVRHTPDPADTGAGPDSGGTGLALSRALTAAALVQRAEGIRMARRGTHPCRP